MRRLIATVLLSAATRAEGQIFHSSELAGSRGGWSFDVTGQMASPVGDFRSNVDRAWGGGLAVRYHFPTAPLLGLRADFGLLNYGNESKEVPLSATVNRVIIEQHTTNNIGLITFGPELAAQSGIVRPYVYGFGGWSVFYTESSANDEEGGYAFASSVNFSDAGGAAGWGGGLRIPLRLRTSDVSIDGGARYTRNWTRSYLRPGDVLDQPDGSLLFNTRRTSADFWQVHLGASFSPRQNRR